MSTAHRATYVGLAAFSGSLFAAAQEPANGPSWEVIAVGVVGLLMVVIGAVVMTWAAAVSSRVTRNEEATSENKAEILRLGIFIRDNYHGREEVNAELSEIRCNIDKLVAIVHKMQMSVQALHGRMDVLLGRSTYRGSDDGSATG